MIDIYCTGGALLGVMMRYDVLLAIMQDNVVKPDEFIEIKFEDGTKGAVKKRHITAFCESQENIEA